MFYTKYFSAACASLLTAMMLTACSNNADKTNSAAEQVAASADTNKSLNVELTLYKKAIVALNENKLDDAKKLFTEMSELQPDMAGPWANLALIAMKNGDLSLAQQHVDRALQKNPNMSQALNLSGSLALQNGRINDAKSLFKQAITHKPDYALAHYNLALLYDVYYQDLPQAIAHYELYLQHYAPQDGQPDKDTQRWLKGLKSTVGANNA